MAEADCLGVLYGRKLISEDAFRAGRNYALLTALARRSWGLSEGSVNALWHRLISGTVEDIGTPRPVWADSSTDSIELARMALARRRQVLTEAGLHVLFVVNSVCVDNYWSKQLKRLVNGQPGKRGDWLYLSDLKEGLHRLAELRSSRRREVVSEAEAAE